MNQFIDTWKKMFQFSGRASRSEFWNFILYNLLVSFVVFYFTAQSGLILLYLIYFLASFICFISLSVRRMHDVGKNGWHLLRPIRYLILIMMEGEKGENLYGPDPNDDTHQTYGL